MNNQSALPIVSVPHSSLPQPHLTLIKDGERPVRLKKDGTPDRRRSNAKTGKSTEVYAFKTLEEINAMNSVFDRRIANSLGNDRQTECRNKLLFNIGINIGLRVSDLRLLKWSFFFDENDMFKDMETLMPKKQRKQKKIVKVFCNANVEEAIEQYISQYPIKDLNDYLFYSNQTKEPLLEKSIYSIIKSAAKEAGIQQNIGSHSLRKTFGYWAWHLSNDKEATLVKLSHIFKHSDLTTTRKYIGILDTDLQEVYDSLDFGEDYLNQLE